MQLRTENKELRVGIAGLGGIAKRTHLPVLRLVPGYKVVSGAEKDQSQRERVAGIFEIEQTYEDYSDMIDEADIDAVFVCLPATLHADAVKKALQKGLHVFCEKPMGISSVEAKEMVSMAESANRYLMPGYNLKYVDNFMRARELVASGKLGKILQINAVYFNPGPYISWDPKSDWYLDGSSKGVLYDIGSHLVDLLFYLYPHSIKRLSAFAVDGYRPYAAITNLSCSYESENGLMGTIQLGWRTASEACNFEFHGTAGTLIVNRRNFSYTHGATDPADRIFTSINNATQEIYALVRKLNRMRQGVDVLEEFVRQAGEFREAALNGDHTLEKAKAATNVHKVLNTILTSVNNGGGVHEIRP